MRLFVYVVLVFMIFAASVAASPVTLSVRGLDTGGYVLSHSTATGEVSYTAFCLDKNLTLPGSADFTLIPGDAMTRVDAALLQRAAWISQQSLASMTDRQAAIWSVMGASVALSDNAQRLLLESQGHAINLSLVQVWVPVNADHQRYLVIGIASSTPPIRADVPEPASLVLVGLGMGLIARRLRVKAS